MDAEQQREVDSMLDTSLDGYLGPAYNYDDNGLTEEWMINFRDDKFEASEADVIRTQIESLLDIMTTQVQDRVCNERRVVSREPIGLGKDLKEVPVWGIDSYTRKILELLVADRSSNPLKVVIKAYIERVLLPSINAMPSDKAHNMADVVKTIIDVSSS